MFTEVCAFEDGVHIFGPPGCIHQRGEDEQGEHMPVGWTVQNADAYAAFLREEKERENG